LPANEANYRKYFFDTNTGTPVDVTTYSISDIKAGDSTVTVDKSSVKDSSLIVNSSTEKY
jgi:hypothetical protein